jgi:pectinesterase
VGLNKDPADRGQVAAVDTATTAADPSLSQWVVQKSNGAFGTAIIMPSAAAQPYAQDGYNQLLLASVNSGQPLRYYVGAAWDRGGEFTSRQAWLAYVAAEAARVRSPVKVTLSAAAQ